MEFIRKFTELKIVKEDRDFWLNRYIGIDEGNFTWRSHWSKGHGILVRCGDFSYVPLMGTRGCVAYTPTLVLRQFEHLQYIPYTKGLVEMEFEYDSQGSENNLYKVKKAWERLSFRQEDPCSDTDEAITLYGTWVREKAKEVVVPHAATISHPPPIEVPTRDFEAEFAMKEKLREEEMKRKLDEVEVEKKKWLEERAQLMKRLARAEKEKRKYQDVAQSASLKQIEQMERQIHETREVAKHRLEQMGCLKAKIEELEENLEEEKEVHKQQMENWENGYENMKKLKTQEEEDKEFLRCQCEDMEHQNTRLGNALQKAREMVTLWKQQYELLKEKKEMDKGGDASETEKWKKRFEYLMENSYDKAERLRQRVQEVEAHTTPFALPTRDLEKLFEECKSILNDISQL